MKECGYKVTNSVSHIMGKAQCRARVRYLFGDGTMTCQLHSDRHRAKLHGQALVALKELSEKLHRLPQKEVQRRINNLLKEGSQCARL